MRAAEKLIAQRGVENVSIREIVTEAKQKNESVLQYHFQNISGLLAAIHAERTEEIRARRADALEDALNATANPSLRTLCKLMVSPAFELGRASKEFRCYIKAFGHQLALADTSPLKLARSHGGGGPSGQQLGNLLRSTLHHLDDDEFLRRLEAALTLCSASMYRQARQSNAFRGKQAGSNN